MLVRGRGLCGPGLRFILGGLGEGSGGLGESGSAPGNQECACCHILRSCCLYVTTRAGLFLCRVTFNLQRGVGSSSLGCQSFPCNPYFPNLCPFQTIARSLKTPSHPSAANPKADEVVARSHTPGVPRPPLQLPLLQSQPLPPPPPLRSLPCWPETNLASAAQPLAYRGRNCSHRYCNLSRCRQCHSTRCRAGWRPVVRQLHGPWHTLAATAAAATAAAAIATSTAAASASTPAAVPAGDRFAIGCTT